MRSFFFCSRNHLELKEGMEKVTELCMPLPPSPIWAPLFSYIKCAADTMPIQKEINHDMIKRVVPFSHFFTTLYLFSCKLAKGESSFCYHLTDSTQLGQGLLPGNYLFYFPRAKKIIWPGIFLHPSPLPLIMKSAAFTAFISCFCGKRLLVAGFRGKLTSIFLTCRGHNPLRNNQPYPCQSNHEIFSSSDCGLASSYLRGSWQRRNASVSSTVSCD